MGRAALVVMVLVILAGCAGRAADIEPTPTQPSVTVTPTAVETPTPEPTQTETAVASGIPYYGAARCTNLIDAESLDELVAKQLSLTGVRYAEKVARSQFENPGSGVAVGSFPLNSGLLCGWSSGYTVDVTYAYGPLSDKLRAYALDSLGDRGYVLVEGAGYDRYEPGDLDEGWGTYAFGNGNWAMASTFGAGDLYGLLDEVVANAPAWDEPENLPAVSNDPLPTTAAEPAQPPFLTTEGLGELRIGQPVPENNSFLTWRPDTCYSSWLTRPPYGDYQVGTNALSVYTEGHKKNGALIYVVLNDDTIPTKSGIRVGDSEARLLATIGSLEKSNEADSTLYSVADATGRVVFEVAKHNSLIGAYRAGEIVGIALQWVEASPEVTAPSEFAPCTL